jgi:hypothetical protein
LSWVQAAARHLQHQQKVLAAHQRENMRDHLAAAQ